MADLPHTVMRYLAAEPCEECAAADELRPNDGGVA
jgi:hypothetical protein